MCRSHNTPHDYFTFVLSTKSLIFQIRLSTGIWLLFAETNEGIEELNIPFDCEFFLAREEANRVTLIEAYRVSLLRPVEYHNFSTWVSGNALSTTPRGIYTRRHDLKGITLKIGILEVSWICGKTIII